MEHVNFDFLGVVPYLDLGLVFLGGTSALVILLLKFAVTYTFIEDKWDRIASVALSCALGLTAVAGTNLFLTNLEQNRVDRESVADALETLLPPDVYAANETAITAFANAAPGWGYDDPTPLELTDGIVEVEVMRSDVTLASMGSGIITYTPRKELEVK